MNLSKRIIAFDKLGKYLHAIDDSAFEEIVLNAKNENSWFTVESIKLTFDGIKRYLDGENLKLWTSAYQLQPAKIKNVAVVMAGNIPLVGFHDFLSILISGHSIQIKLSSKDTFLIKHLIGKLTEIEPDFAAMITFAEQIKNFDAVIATGSDNAARYFHYYFKKYPNIIRKNRTSCAVLNGKESNEDFVALGKDVFSYYGLGCRNVSKLFVPKGYVFNSLFESWNPIYDKIIHHHKYNNNYEYQKSIMLVNLSPFLDTGYVMLQESERLVSPISVLFYETYENEADLALKLLAAKEKLQCIVGSVTPDSVPFGQAQSPNLWDYADQVDTLKFLEKLG